MNEIDFLPSSYRERITLAKARTWRYAAILLLLLAAGGVTAAQHAQYRAAKQQETRLHDLCAQAAVQEQRLTVSREQLEHARNFAELYTYLRHPWPRSQILAGIVQPLPQSMWFSEVVISQEGSTSDRLRSGALGAATPPSGENETLHPAQRDLQRLQQACDEVLTAVHIAGGTHDTIALHGYVATLNKSPLFTRAELESLESSNSEQLPPIATFRLRLLVRRGYEPGEHAAPADATQPRDYVARSHQP